MDQRDHWKEACGNICKELDLNGDQVVFAKKDVKLNKVLDLSNEKIRQQLGVDLKSITHREDYETTHQLGTIAKELGFDGIIAPSSYEPSVNNIIIFGE